MSNYLVTNEVWEKWKEIIDGNEPHASIRIGDVEAVVAAHNEIMTMKSVNELYTWVRIKDVVYGGVVLPNEDVREKVVESFRQADFLGILSQTSHWKFKPIADIVVDYYKLNPKSFFYGFDNYEINIKPEFYEWFKDKKVLLVGSKSKYLQEVLERRYGWTGIVGCVDCQTWNNVEEAKKDMDNYSYRVALVSAGIAGKILCAYAKEKGNVGIDFGSAADNILETDLDGFNAWEVKRTPKRDYDANSALIKST